jgi:hypothetical protein
MSIGSCCCSDHICCSQYKNTADAAVDAVREILRQCAESKTVKRVIHTASISTASPLIDVPGAGVGAAGYRDFIDESCWTPLDVDYPLRSAHFDVISPPLFFLLQSRTR